MYCLQRVTKLLHDTREGAAAERKSFDEQLASVTKEKEQCEQSYNDELVKTEALQKLLRECKAHLVVSVAAGSGRLCPLMRSGNVLRTIYLQDLAAHYIDSLKSVSSYLHQTLRRRCCYASTI